MKTYLCLAVVCAFVALVYSEDCTDASTCSHTHCTGDGVSTACTGGQCTCHKPGTACSKAGDCPTAHCRLGGWHCVDSECHCPFNDLISGGGGGGFLTGIGK